MLTAMILFSQIRCLLKTTTSAIVRCIALDWNAAGTSEIPSLTVTAVDVSMIIDHYDNEMFKSTWIVSSIILKDGKHWEGDNEYTNLDLALTSFDELATSIGENLNSELATYISVHKYVHVG